MVHGQRQQREQEDGWTEEHVEKQAQRLGVLVFVELWPDLSENEVSGYTGSYPENPGDLSVLADDFAQLGKER